MPLKTCIRLRVVQLTQKLSDRVLRTRALRALLWARDQWNLSEKTRRRLETLIAFAETVRSWGLVSDQLHRIRPLPVESVPMPPRSYTLEAHLAWLWLWQRTGDSLGVRDYIAFMPELIEEENKGYLAQLLLGKRRVRSG
jgi:hypothetical protein